MRFHLSRRRHLLQMQGHDPSPASFQQLSPAARPRVSLQQQQRSPAAASPARPAAANAAPDSGFVITPPVRLGPMMIVPGSGGAVANGPAGAAGPAEGATAAQAPSPPTHTGAVSEQLRTQANDVSTGDRRRGGGAYTERGILICLVSWMQLGIGSH